MDNSKAIITQVAAKIASELTINKADLGLYADNFEAVTELLMQAIYGGAQATPEAMVAKAFPQATSAGFTVSIKNDQQGPIPEWLVSSCQRDGVTEVYDNRADLAANPKRPWFKAVNDKEKAYWPPKGA
jgi:hypothetical protein